MATVKIKTTKYSLIEKAKQELGSKFKHLDNEIKCELESIDKLRRLSDRNSLSASDILPA